MRETRTFPGDGTWAVLEGQRLQGDLAPLLAALSAPDITKPPTVPLGTDVGCTADLVIPPRIVLFDAVGHEARIRWPSDFCDKPQPAVSAALSSLQATTIQVLKLEQVLTQQQNDGAKAAQKVGCQSQWKDEFRLGAVSDRLNTGTPINWTTGTLSACLFKDDGKDPSTGDFVAGRKLGVTERTTFLATLAKPGHGKACANDHTEFLVLSSGNGYVSVEVGGCSRVQRADGADATLGSADPAGVQWILADVIGSG